jgi:hypothetical protein
MEAWTELHENVRWKPVGRVGGHEGV